VFWTRLHYKLFATDDRNHLLPNLWVICANHFSLFLQSLDQFIAFSLMQGNIEFYLAAINASTNYVKHRQLCLDLASL